MGTQRKISSLAGAAGSCMLAAGFAFADPCEPHWDLAMGVTGLNGTVEALSEFDSGTGPVLYAGGLFQTPYSRIAQWHSGQWHDVSGGVSGAVRTLQVFDFGTGPALYVGGDFTHAGGWLEVNRVARWDGQDWTGFGAGLAGGLVAVRALAKYDDGSGAALYAGGNFTLADNQPANRVAKWDGQQWLPVGEGLNNHVYDLVGFDTGSGPRLYAVGTFTQTGSGQPASRFAQWDGQQWTEAGGGLGGNGLVIKVYDDGSGEALYVGGHFTTAGPIAANRVARWDGQQWTALGSGMNSMVNGLTAFDDGSGTALYASGLFTQADGNPVQFVARWDGASWSALDGGPNGGLMAATVFDDGTGASLVVGGSFLQVNSQPANRVAEWRSCPDPGCYADCDGNGILNIDDFMCFINEFAHAQTQPVAQQVEHYANCAGNTAAPVLNVDDFMCFINEFSQGCP